MRSKETVENKLNERKMEVLVPKTSKAVKPVKKVAKEKRINHKK